ncbi:hypothetical protein Cadr_000011601 [Camelus dromedarius]|uniref:Uncharacterized protein n=1 Tax=Camelus dromedarius TaxID=9838 RepID=A0A5N4DV06_CAMDR|nr:hypothetical protein Cadr_000011601 [Camelus dromedarius]
MIDLCSRDACADPVSVVFMVIDTIYQLIVDYREGKIPNTPSQNSDLGQISVFHPYIVLMIHGIQQMMTQILLRRKSGIQGSTKPIQAWQDPTINSELFEECPSCVFTD